MLSMEQQKLVAKWVAGNDGLPGNWTDKDVVTFCKERGAVSLADAFRLGVRNFGSLLTPLLKYEDSIIVLTGKEEVIPVAQNGGRYLEAEKLFEQLRNEWVDNMRKYIEGGRAEFIFSIHCAIKNAEVATKDAVRYLLDCIFTKTMVDAAQTYIRLRNLEEVCWDLEHSQGWEYHDDTSGAGRSLARARELVQKMEYDWHFNFNCILKECQYEVMYEIARRAREDNVNLPGGNGRSILEGIFSKVLVNGAIAVVNAAEVVADLDDLECSQENGWVLSHGFREESEEIPF